MNISRCHAASVWFFDIYTTVCRLWRRSACDIIARAYCWHWKFECDCLRCQYEEFECTLKSWRRVFNENWIFDMKFEFLTKIRSIGILRHEFGISMHTRSILLEKTIVMEHNLLESGDLSLKQEISARNATNHQTKAKRRENQCVNGLMTRWLGVFHYGETRTTTVAKVQDKSWDLSAATHLKSAFIVLNHY